MKSLRELLVAGLMGAAASSLIGSPHSSLRGTLFVSLLLLPPALIWALLAFLAGRTFPSLEARPRAAARILIGAQLGLGAGAAGVYLVNLLLVDSPFGPWARAGYALTALAAMALVAVSSGLVDRTARRISERGLASVLAALLIADGVIAGLLDSYGIRPEYGVHKLLGQLSVAGLSMGAQLWLRGRVSRRALLLSAVAAVAALLCSLPDRADLYRSLAAGTGAHGRVFAQARSLADRDGDHFSSWLGGGDCDDGDAAAYPLSPTRDCLGWRQQRLPPLPALPSIAAGDGSPRLILLVTIDAFRCGFGVSEASPLRDACPALTRIAREGWANLGAHASVPNTSASLTILMTGNPHANPLDRPRRRPTLPQRLHEAGYRTEVFVSFPLIILDRALHDAFDDIHLDYVTTVNAPYEGDKLADGVLQRARQVLDDPSQRTFLWAHFPDAHFPWMVDDSLFKRTSIGDYATMIRRTDADLGRLLSALSQHPRASDALVVVTADHGEAFGEHNERFHGFNLYEEVVRVPIIAWSPGQPRRFLDAPPPASLAQLGGYLLGALQPSAPRDHASPDVLLRTVLADRQFGVLSGGWKLVYNATRNLTQLFDLDRDPEERRDVSTERPEKVQELGRALGRLLSPLPYGRVQGRN